MGKVYKDFFNHVYCNNIFTRDRSGFMPSDSDIFVIVVSFLGISSYFDGSSTLKVGSAFLDIFVGVW